MNKILYSDKEQVEEKILTLRKEWHHKLYVVADFDRTLTYSRINGEKKMSMIAVMRKNPTYLWSDYFKKANELFDRYHPIEVNEDISFDEKNETMTQWWKEHLKLLVDSGLHRKHIGEVVNSWIIKMRSGVIDFMKLLQQADIPLIIVSANVLWGDSIRDYLRTQQLLTSNIAVVSNSFEFDENGKAIWYKQDVIQVFNKGDVVFSKFWAVQNLIQNRPNIILLWDSLWDPDMANGTQYDNILKVGFYNDETNERISYYQKKYDIVLTGDSDGDFLKSIL